MTLPPVCHGWMELKAADGFHAGRLYFQCKQCGNVERG